VAPKSGSAQARRQSNSEPPPGPFKAPFLTCDFARRAGKSGQARLGLFWRDSGTSPVRRDSGEHGPGKVRGKGGHELAALFISPALNRTTPRRGCGSSRPSASRRCHRRPVHDRASEQSARAARSCNDRYFACAVRRRRFPVGENPTRRTLQPEATGAVMEVTKGLKPSV